MLVRTDIKITEEDYNKLRICSQAEFYNYVEDIANNSAFPPCGYGFTSPNYFEKSGEYFISWGHWDSCD